MSQFRCYFAVALAFVLIGCRQGTVSSPNSANDEQTSEEANSEKALKSALYQLHPENFGINSNPDKPVSLLNTWRLKQLEKKGGGDNPMPVKAPTGWIASDEETRLAQSKFDFGDALRIRDSLLYRAIANYLSDRGRDELQRANGVVDFVCRNITLWKDDELDLPLPSFLALFLGRGSAEDRAWICSEIFTQLRIDSVVLRAKADVKQSSEKWLLGVSIDRQIYLFDLRLGLPVKNGDGNSTATLSEISAHPEWLERMSVSEPYCLNADDLRDISVFVMSDTNFWCHRMHLLETVLPTDDACIIYAPLLGGGGETGLLQRIADVGGWQIEDLKLWQYPQRQTKLAGQMPEAAAQEYVRLQKPFSVPIPYSVDDKGTAKIGKPENKMQRYRIDQLLGHYADVTQRYLRIRHLEVEQFPPEIARLNRWAAEDAYYWTTLCKFEAAEYEPAVEQLTGYLKKYDKKGKWYFAARSLLAQSYAELGNLPQAIATLEQSSSDDPYRATNALRLKQWSTKPSQPVDSR